MFSHLSTAGIVSLCFLAYLVPDRTKPDHEKIIYFAPVSKLIVNMFIILCKQTCICVHRMLILCDVMKHFPQV